MSCLGNSGFPTICCTLAPLFYAEVLQKYKTISTHWKQYYLLEIWASKKLENVGTCVFRTFKNLGFECGNFDKLREFWNVWILELWSFETFKFWNFVTILYNWNSLINRLLLVNGQRQIFLGLKPRALRHEPRALSHEPWTINHWLLHELFD